MSYVVWSSDPYEGTMSRIQIIYVTERYVPVMPVILRVEHNMSLQSAGATLASYYVARLAT